MGQMGQGPGEMDTRSAQLAAGAMAAAPVIYAAIGLGMRFGGMMDETGLAGIEDDLGPLLGIIFLVLGTLFVAVSFVLRMRVSGGQGIMERFRFVLICMALAETAGVLGLVHLFLTGSLTIPCALWGIALVGAAFHFPTRSWLEQDHGCDA